MKTEKEKMTQGEPYKTGDPQLMRDKKRARIIAEQYNHSSEDDEKSRKDLLKQLFGSCGVNAFIKPSFHCDYGYNIHIGDNFFANFDCVILDAAPVSIGDHCMFGPKTCIFAVSHPINPAERNNGVAFGKPVYIGNNVWLGGSCTVLPGITIGDNAVVGAGSVVTKDIPDNAIVAGNPAKIIRYLEEE